MRPDSEFRLECREWFDGTIHNDDSADDVRDADLSLVHQLSGPTAVEGAEPGDLLVVDVLDLGPVPQETGPVAGQGWGYTGIFARDNGGGFLTDHFPETYKAVWDFHGHTASSRHLPGVGFTGITHPGLMGTAPSVEMLATWNGREGALRDTDPARVPPLALPPEPHHARLGGLSGPEFDRVAGEAARTTPPRENGGNQDIKNLSRGSRVFYPVFVLGAKFSTGDLHAIEYLTKFGYTPEQAYLILGAAPIEGRLSGVVDIPNACATVYLPTAIFDDDIRPTAGTPQRVDRGQCAVSS